MTKREDEKASLESQKEGNRVEANVEEDNDAKVQTGYTIGHNKDINFGDSTYHVNNNVNINQGQIE